jgi:hypothetical protein
LVRLIPSNRERAAVAEACQLLPSVRLLPSAMIINHTRF